MCGIVGVRDDWLRRRQTTPDQSPEQRLEQSLQNLRWRGPNGTGIVRIGDWWLGCARLAITQPGSSQPVVRRGGGFAAVCNGAITNARELWRELLPGAEQRDAPPNDAWLPLLAVAQDRRNLLAAMRGHHAYAVVRADSNELILGQDRFGEKPLFCLQSIDAGEWQTVAFGSTPRALAPFGMPKLTLGDRTAVFLRQGFCDVTPQQFSATLRLTSLPRPGPREGSTPRQTAAATAPLRDRFFAGVARCVDTTVPRGLFLSGGIDSSCIAAALRHLAIPVPAYQFRAAGAPATERSVAHEVAQHCGLDFRTVDGGPEVLDALPQLTRNAGLPLGDPSICAAHAVARAARADGIVVMLSGEGADELFVGYRRYRALAWLPRLRWLARVMPQWSLRYAARWLRATAAADPAASLLAVTPPAFGRLVLGNSEAITPPQPPRSREDRLTGRLEGQLEGLLERAQRSDIDGYLRFDLLPKIDVATMAAGIESRCPWLEGDYRPTRSLRAELGKRSLRDAFAGDLPARVFRQPKRGFGLPLDTWFRGDLPWLDLLRERRTLAREHLRPGGVATAIDRHRNGAANLGHGLYLLVAHELFLRCQEEPSTSPS